MALKIIWEQVIYNTNNPLKAAKEAVEQIKDGDALQFTVIDELTGERYSVDLQENDEEAVLEIVDVKLSETPAEDFEGLARWNPMEQMEKIMNHKFKEIKAMIDKRSKTEKEVLVDDFEIVKNGVNIAFEKYNALQKNGHVDVRFLVAYNDGGTKMYQEIHNDNKYYVDYRIKSETEGKVFDRYPGENGAIMLNVKLIIID